MKALLLALTLLAGLILFNPGLSAAYSIKDGVCTDHPEAAACQVSESDPITGPGGLLVRIAGIISYVAGAAAIILIIVGAIRYITSGGDPGNVKKARDTIVYALVGVAVIVAARALIFFVVSFYK